SEPLEVNQRPKVRRLSWRKSSNQRERSCGYPMPRNGRKKLVGKCEESERQTRENELADLEDALREEWSGRPEDDSPSDDEPDDFDEEWDDLDDWDLRLDDEQE